MLQNTAKTKDVTSSNYRKQSKFTTQFFLALAITIALLTVPLATSSAFAEEDVIHIVRPGESLSLIAAQYGVNMYVLARYNRIRNINFLRIGQRLRIPGTTVAPTLSRPATPTPTSVNSGYSPNSYKTRKPTPYVVDRNYPTPTPTPVIPTPISRRPAIRFHVVIAFDTLTSKIGRAHV